MKDAENNSTKRWFFGVLPIFFIVPIIAITGINLTSSYFTLSPRIALDEWSCYGKPGDEQSWNAELNNLLIANTLDPWNADIYMDLGRMYEWKALAGEAWNSETKEARAEASRYFKLAVENRPTWDMAWISLAQSKLLNREVDDEVFNAISKGLEYGQWHKEAQEKILWLAIGIWKKLPENLQLQVRSQVAQLLTRDDSIYMLAKLAMRFQWFDELNKLVTKTRDIDYIASVRTNKKKARQMLGAGQKPKEFVCRV